MSLLRMLQIILTVSLVVALAGGLDLLLGKRTGYRWRKILWLFLGSWLLVPLIWLLVPSSGERNLVSQMIGLCGFEKILREARFCWDTGKRSCIG